MYTVPSSITACPFPKVFVNCSTAGTGELGVQCAQTCLNLDNDDCVSCFCCCVQVDFLLSAETSNIYFLNLMDSVLH